MYIFCGEGVLWFWSTAAANTSSDRGVRRGWQAGRQAAAMESLLGRLASLHQLLRIEHNFTVPHVTVSTVWYHAHKVLCAHNRILAVTMLQTML